MASQNYVVQYLHYGDYKRGDVIPDYVAKQGGDVADLIARGVILPTAEAVNCDIVPPKVVASTAEADLFLKNKELTAEAEKIKTVAELHEGRAAEFERQANALRAELADKVTELDRLKGVIAEKDAALAAKDEELKAAHELLNAK